MTPESENKVRVFPPFPRLREINSTEVYSLNCHRGHSDTLAEMSGLKRCQITASRNAKELLFIRMAEKMTLLDNNLPEPKQIKIA